MNMRWWSGLYIKIDVSDTVRENKFFSVINVELVGKDYWLTAGIQLIRVPEEPDGAGGRR